MGALDPFGRTDQLDEATLEALVGRFEARGASPVFSGMLEGYLDVLGLDGAARVLDLGCGTGLAARAVARRADFSGTVLGIDLSPHLVAAAQRLARDEGVHERLDFRTGDARAIEAGDATFDAVVAHTLVSHVEDPSSVVREAARVLRPGGMLGIFDGDYASLTFGHADPVRGQAFDEALIRALVTNPRVMRQLPRWLPYAGLDLVESFAHVLSEIGRARFWSSAVEAYRRLLPQAGVMSGADADAWAADLARDSDEGVFFGSCNYYAYVAGRR